MADDEAPYQQIETILRVVLTSPAFNPAGFTRGLVVTDEIADFKVSEHRVLVHPEWAVEKGPLDAAKQIIFACSLFDQRRADARRARDAELRSRLFDVVEDIRRAGAEYLLVEVYEAPVARRRSLERLDEH